ncbi:MAG: aspartate aminotransferase family protein [Gammaproteobacteria bacterium]|nr:aspartate aminotransferase family protein [Gammaproteobacteria bacterium]
MKSDQFRRYGHQLIDQIADYIDHLEDYPVQSHIKPGDIRSQLPPQAPEHSESFDAILSDFENIIMPGITHWQSPNFFGYFPANHSGPSILAELLSAGLGVQGMLWLTSPAATELETHMLDWLIDALGLPSFFKSTESGGGVIQDSASSAVLCALLSARERSSQWQSNHLGIQQHLVAYTSAHAHSSVEKAIRIAGIGSDNLRLIAVDENHAMRADALAHAIKTDQQNGLLPFFVCATIGTTSTTAIDPVNTIGPFCKQHDIWLHIDAALAGSAAICPEFRWLHNDLHYADSYCFNPHKWLLTNFDCDCFYVKQRSNLTQTLGVNPEYLKNTATDTGKVFDYRDWQIPLGRRFRSLKLWFVIRFYGLEGLRSHIRNHVELSQQFSEWIDAHPDFELMAPNPLNLICFRHRSDNIFNQKLLETLNASGECFLTHTQLNKIYALRVCIGGTYTRKQHVQKLWQLIQKTSQTLQTT